ncbi:MAG: hypothetical protein KGH55_02950 [Nanoarchaeota archaeon]|nr:hypothetical protein [Nanoarchaeota archaeon]
MNILNYLGFRKRKDKTRRGEIVESVTEFNYKRGTIKTAGLEKLAWPVEDFAKHIGTVLSGTGYIIGKITDRQDIYGGYYAQIEIQKVRMGPERFLGHSYAGTITLTKIKKNPTIKIRYDNSNHLKDYEIRLKNYDLSKLIGGPNP